MARYVSANKAVVELILAFAIHSMQQVSNGGSKSPSLVRIPFSSIVHYVKTFCMDWSQKTTSN